MNSATRSEIVLDDGSGRVARIDPRAVRFRLPLPYSDAGQDGRQQVESWLKGAGAPRVADYLAAQGRVSVMGTVQTADAGHREAAPALRFSTREEIVRFDPLLEPGASVRERLMLGCAVVGMVVFALATGVTLAAALRG